MIIHSKEELTSFLSQLPKETDRDFEKKIVSLCTEENQDKNFYAWTEELANTEFSSESEEKVAFAAFCILSNIARRSFDRTKETDLINGYREKFGNHAFYKHLKLLCMLDNHVGLDHEEILELAYENSRNIYTNAGVQHALADAVATLFEENEFTPEQCPDKLWLERGMEAVLLAINFDSAYAKFYCTKARILSLQGNHKEALRCIDTAIDYENSKNKDYALRVGRYQMHAQTINNRLHNQLMRQQLQEEMTAQKEAYITEMQQRQEELETQTNRSRIKNMEFIGLFAGIISFTIGGLNIAQGLAGQSIIAVAGLIIVLMGALLGVYAGFGVILHGFRGKESVRNYIVFAMGLLLIVGGVILCLR
ncbi:MAG: hypothetical protein IJ298_09305 [Ruminococcus sp.]|nr:hypothetical protein [Ruminococcus sp.]